MLHWKTEPIFLDVSAQGRVSSGLSPFLSIYGHREAISRDRLGRSVTKTFRLVLCGSDSQLIFGSRQVDSEEEQLFYFYLTLVKWKRINRAVFSFLLSLDSWEAAGYILLLTGVFCGQLFRDLFCVLCLRPLAQRSSWWVRDGVEVRVRRREDCLLRLFGFCYIFVWVVLIYQCKRDLVW